MWLKNAFVFRSAVLESLDAVYLAQALRRRACPECGPRSLRTDGFAAPIKGLEDFVYDAPQGFLLGCFQEARRVLPASVVDDEIDKVVAAIEDREGRIVSKKEIKGVRDDVIFDLTPKAFVKTTQVSFVIDVKRGRIYIDASSEGRSEMVVSALRDALGTLPSQGCLPPDDHVSASMDDWLRDLDCMPDDITMGDRCDMKADGDERDKVRCSDTDLQAAEVLAHLDVGLHVDRLNLLWQDAISFDLGTNLNLRRIQALQETKEAISDTEADDAVIEFMTKALLQCTLLRDVFDSLDSHFGVTMLDNGVADGTPVEDAGSVPGDVSDDSDDVAVGDAGFDNLQRAV